MISLRLLTCWHYVSLVSAATMLLLLTVYYVQAWRCSREDGATDADYES